MKGLSPQNQEEGHENGCIFPNHIKTMIWRQEMARSQQKIAL